jgi:hypothetical protein
MKNLVVSFGISLALLFVAACTPGPNSSGNGTPNGGQGPVVQGTVSGGGGNGCEGKAFETYAKRISTLQEYQLYLRPLLRRMAESSRDPFVTYLLWAAEEKAWYFVPCELEKLSSEQIGVAVQSDQLARHGENGVFIYSREPAKGVVVTEDLNRPNYATKKMKVKAVLLLHEMVMGARMLMKKSPHDQCTALAKRDAKLCSDPETMAIANTVPFDPKQAGVMDAVDHDAVRMMTTFLSEKDVDLSTASLRATRERLGFSFPWSRAVSDIDLATLHTIFNRAAQMGDRFSVVNDDGAKTYFKGLPMTCGIQYRYDTRSENSDLSVQFVTKFDGNKSADIDAYRNTFKDAPMMSYCAADADRVSFLAVSPQNWNSACSTKDQLLASSQDRYMVWATDDFLRARGVLINGVVYDEVTLRAQSPQAGGRYVDLAVMQILVTRDKAPRILSIRMTPKEVLKKPGSQKLYGKDLMRDDLELLDVEGSPSIECRNQSLAS